MKKTFKFLTVFLLVLLGASVQPSWAGYRKGNIVFDASGWGDPSYVYFCIVRETGSWYTETKQINRISNTHLYYAWTSNGDNWWDSPTYWAFIGQSSSFGSGAYGYSNLQNAAHYTGKYTIGSYNIDNNNLYYFSKSSSNNGASIDVTYYDNPSKLNKEVKVGSKVKLAGGSYTDQVGSVAKVYAKYYEFPSDKYAVNNKYSSDYKTVSKGTKGTESIYSALTSDVNFSYSDLASGYKFDGWYNGSGTKINSNNAFTEATNDGKTVYAYFSEISYSITYKDQGDEDFSGTGWGGTGTHPTSYSVTTATITLDQPTKIGYTFGGWFSEKTCTAGNEVTQITKGSTGDKTLYAKWTLDAPSDPSISGELSYVVGQTISLTASATGIMLSYQWYKNNGEISGATSATYTKANCTTADAGTYKCVMTNDAGSVNASVDVTVMANSYNITIAVNNSDYGTVSQSSINDVPEGTSINFGNTGALVVGTTSVTATPTTTTAQYAYAFTGWTSSDYTTGGTIAKAGTVTANFTQTLRTYTITFNANTGSGSMANQTNVSYGVSTKLNTMSGLSKTGYSFAGWAESANGEVAYADGADITIYENKTLYAKWTAKTYTISFDNNGGTGGQTETVTATYDQPMPGNVTCPTRVGYKFKGYYSAATSGTQYYKADGTATTNKWQIDAAGGTATLYAQWTQLYCFIEGRFSVATSKARTDWKHVADSFGEWNENSTRIRMDWDSEKNCYKLVTWATMKELSDKQNNNYQFFSIKQSESSTALVNSVEYMQAVEGDLTLADAGVKKNWVKHTSGGVIRPHFDDTDRSGFVIIYFDEKQLWFEIDPIVTYSVTISASGSGSVSENGVKNIGEEVKWSVTATPSSDRYRFERWDVTGGAHVENAKSETTKVWATANGTVTATFVANTRLYFQKPSSWSGTPYVYFYSDAGYWTKDKSSDGTEKGAGSKGMTGKMMTHLQNNTYVLTYNGTEAHKALAFTDGQKDDQENFDEASVSYRTDFNHCGALNWFIPDGTPSGYYNKHNNKQSAYYNNGYWTSYYDKVEFYVRTNADWDVISGDMRFQPTNDANIYKMIWKNLVANQSYYFKIWQTCDCWYGCSATITDNVDNYNFYTTTNDNCELKPRFGGDYELTWNASTNALSVRYLADFYVRSFPEAVSVVPNGIKRVEPKIDLRDGYDVTKLQVSISGFDNTIATLEQSGYNIIVTGQRNGTTTATVTYRYNNNLEFVYNLTIVVGPAVTIQAKIADGDGKWIYTNMVNVHYWLSGKTADVNMTYTESGDDKYYTASIPLPEDQETFNMMFWYGENIDMSASDVWRKTGNIENLDIYTDGTKTQTQSYCFTIKHTAGDDKQRDEEHATGLCIQADAIYQVEVTMKNGKMYTSNVVSTNGETVSFFAPSTSAPDYTKGTIRLMKNGAEIMETIVNTTPGIYTATLNIPTSGNATLSNKTLYSGPFYVLSGLSGTEIDANKNEMHQFTPRANTNEDYSFYWTAYTNSAAYKDNKNTIATVANEWNKNLSLTIGSDKKTASDGTVEAGNVRFSYEPTTNEFKRAIIGGSTDNPKFLAIVGNNVYDVDGTTLLDDVEYAQEDTKCKFTDASDWVYEKNIKIKADGVSDAKVYIKAQFNGVLTELLGYEIDPTTGEETTTPKPLVVMGSATSAGTYDIRIIYDYKKNRLLSTWEPPEGEITQDMTIESDVLFVSQEDGDVKQVTIGDVAGESRAAKLTSLQNVMYVKEFSQTGTLKTYWMALPFDCRISDIYGIGGYGTVWRIQKYDGAARATNGWLNESQTFWNTMTMDEEMEAGYGYLLQIVRSKMEFHEIDGKAALRLYFPSKDKGFTMTRSAVGDKKEYPVENCTLKGREAEDSNWKLMGPMAYNNIEVKTVAWDDQASKPEDVTRFPSYLYEYDAVNKTYNVVSATNYNYRSFHAFMTQFGGTIEWQPYTETKHGQAPRFADLSDSFKGGRLSIELVQSEETLDRTFVTLSQYGTEGFDQNKDLTKIAESRSTISTITNDVEYAGNTLPLDIEMVPLNVKVVANGTYDIALAQSLEGLEVRLYDAFEQTTTPLDLMSATVTLDKGEYKDRFFLQFVQKSPLSPTSLNGAIDQFNLPSDKTQKLLINDQIYLINAGRIYNVLGVGE